MEVLAQVIGAIVAEPCRIVFGYVQTSIKNFFKRKSNFIDLKNDTSYLMNLKALVQPNLDQHDQLGYELITLQEKDWVRQVNELKTKVDVLLSAKSTSDGNNLQDSCCPFPLQCKLSNKLARKIEEVNQLMQTGNKMVELKNDMSSLMDLKVVVQQKLDLKDQLGDLPKFQVEDWVRQVDELKRKVDAFLSTRSTSDVINMLSTTIEEVKQLKQSNKEVIGLIETMRDKTKPVEDIPGPSIIDQKTASENLARVLHLLSDDNVTRIGVWGMGGVGKTTLVKNLNNELGKTPSALGFSVVIWVTVSKDTNLRRIQTGIAERLNLEVNMEQNEEKMAIQLHGRLQKERRFLLILDDVWEAIDLDCLGIPRPELCPRSKIVITSRKLDVCRGMMTQRDLQVKALNDEEAWKLFCERAGEVVMEEHIRPVAEMVAKECDGLPLAIIVVGASMRGKSIVELWKDTLRALQMSVPIGKGIEDKVFTILKRSYDSLENKQTKFCFLFCCLFPEDFNIDRNELVRYWYCEGLLSDEHLNYEERNNRGVAIIQSLRDCCLLEDGEEENEVKMHDVVRDVGIWIAESVEDECKSLVRSGVGLTCITENESLSSYKRLSFMNNRITSLPDCVGQCQDVSTLLLQGNEELDTLPSSFIEGFQALKILDLSNSSIISLPSLLQLHQLRALVLSGCDCLTELPPLDGLSRLLVLDCSFSGITHLPESLEKLRNLRQLDISDTKKLETIPYRALSKLSNIESLMLLTLQGVEGERLFEVLPLLKKLIMLDVKLDSIPRLTSNNVNWFKRIKEFRIIIATTAHSFAFRPNTLCFIGVCLSEQESIGWLLCNVDYLKFSGCEGLTQMFNKLVTDNVSFARLKELLISNSDIAFGGGVASFDLLPNLEEIDLRDLSKLESVSDLSRLLGFRFSRLKRIIICDCPQLKCVASLEENQTLEKLEEIHVENCGMLKSLFNYPNPRTPHLNLNPATPNHRKLYLRGLPNLESLWRNEESLQNLQLLLYSCDRVRKLPFAAQNAESIKEISGEEEWWNKLEWDSEDTKMLMQNRFVRIG